MNTSLLFEVLRRAIGGTSYVMRAYSGRLMYGKKCLGIVIPHNVGEWKVTMDIVLQIRGVEYHCPDLVKGADGEAFELDLLANWGNCHSCMDNMGTDKIVYWPEIEWPADMFVDNECAELYTDSGP